MRTTNRNSRRPCGPICIDVRFLFSCLANCPDAEQNLPAHSVFRRSNTKSPKSMARPFCSGASSQTIRRAVVEASRPKAQAPRSRTANVAVFVNADRTDLQIARQLSELLAREGVESYWPITEGSPEKVREDLEANLKACDGLVLIYGASEPSWVRDQLRQGRKILCQRDRPLAALAICLAPPPEKMDLAVALPGLITLDGRAGVTPPMLRQFVERLSPEA